MVINTPRNFLKITTNSLTVSSDEVKVSSNCESFNVLRSNLALKVSSLALLQSRKVRKMRRVFFQKSHLSKYFENSLQKILTIFQALILVDLARITLMQHPFMQTNFLKNMENSWILHGSFRQNINAAYKILQEFICNMNIDKTFIQKLDGLKIVLLEKYTLIYQNKLVEAVCLQKTQT